MKSEQSIGTTPILSEAISSDIAKLKITRLFSTGNYEHAKYEVEIPLPNGLIGQALIAIDQALCALNPSLQPHDSLTQLQYIADRKKRELDADVFDGWQEDHISLYEQWQHNVAYAKQVLDSYTNPQTLHAADQSGKPLLTECRGQYFYAGKRVSNFHVRKIAEDGVTRYIVNRPSEVGVYADSLSGVASSCISFRAYVSSLGNFHWSGNQDALDQLMFYLFDDSVPYDSRDQSDQSDLLAES